MKAQLFKRSLPFRNVLSGCRSFDKVAGGLEDGTITTVYGPESSGRTTFCMMASHTCAMLGKKVAYITCEKLSMERLKQICSEDFETVASRVNFAFPRTIDGLERAIRNAKKIEGVGLFIVDPVNIYYWLEQNKENVFIRSLAEIEMFVKERKIPALLTAQTYEKEREIEPFGFNDIKRVSKLMVELSSRGGKRYMRLTKGGERSLRVEYTMGKRGLI